MNNPIVPTIEHSTNGLVVTSETIAYADRMARTNQGETK